MTDFIPLKNQPYLGLLQTLEELMGPVAYSEWLAAKYPHILENPAARRNQAKLDEIKLKNEVMEKILYLRIGEISRIDMMDRIALLESEINYQEKIKNFNLTISMHQATKQDQLRLENEHLLFLKNNLATRISIVEEHLTAVRSSIRELQQTEKILDKQIKNDLVKRTSIIGSIINSIPETSEALINLRKNLQTGVDKLNNDPSKVEEVNREFNAVMDGIKKHDGRIYAGFASEIAKINAGDQKLIQTVSARTLARESLQEYKEDEKSLLQQLDGLNKIYNQTVLAISAKTKNSNAQSALDNSASTAKMQILLSGATTKEQKSEIKTAKEALTLSPSDISSNVATLLNQSKEVDERRASRAARMNALRERIKSNDSLPGYDTSGADNKLETAALHSQKIRH